MLQPVSETFMEWFRALKDSDVGYKVLFDAAPLGLLTYSRNGEVLEANRFLLDLIGSPSFEATKSINIFTFENLRSKGISGVLQDALEKGQPQGISTTYTSHWGKTAFVNITALPMDQGRDVHERGLAIIQDITHLREIEEKLVDSERRFRMLAERIPLGIAVIDSLQRFDYVNPAFVDIFGSAHEDTPGLFAWMSRALPDPALRAIVRKEFAHGRRDLAAASSRDRFFTVRDQEGAEREICFGVFTLTEGKKVLLCEDVSELVRAWTGHRESEEKYAELVENLTDCIYTLNEDRVLLTVNSAAARTLGYRPDELIGEPLEKIIPPALREQVARNLKEIWKKGFGEGVSQHLARDGSIHYLEYRITLVEPGTGEPYLVGIAHDITERVRMKKALKEFETKFQLLVENAHDGIADIDPDGVIQFTNPQMKEILKDPHPEGKSLKDYYDVENRNILERILLERKKGQSSTYFITLTDLDGEQHALVVSGTPYVDTKGVYRGAIGIFTDISQLRRLEAQLQQSQKMEAIGTLAGGIAHDFNNILSGVLGYASLMKNLAPTGSKLSHYAAMVEKSAERGAALAGQLLAFSRKSSQFVQTVDVHQIVDDVVEILKRTLDPRVTVLCAKNARRSAVEGDPGQIQQILMNLCINSKDAMPGGGRIVITTDVVDLDDSFCRTRDNLEPGAFLEITVEDTGEGMTEIVKRRLFEPFFTTKEDGKGTGLGLAMVYGAVKSHHGYVEVESEPARGALFRVLLPLKGTEGTVPVCSVERELTKVAGSILIVDDEAIIRDVLTEMLQEMGFHVVTACDGIEGLDLYRRLWDQLDLVILDMVMPKLSGKETFLEMKRINPSIRAILSTGFAEEAVAKDALDRGIMGFIKKPYRIQDLSELICQVLALPQEEG